MKILILPYAWPRRDWSAAARRIWDWIEIFDLPTHLLRFISPSQLEDETIKELERRGWKCQSIPPNDSRFDQEIADYKPDLVLFDRFITEEMYGARVVEQCPEALRILETQDLHFVRKSRGEAISKNRDLKSVASLDIPISDHLLLRELASFHRSDLVSVISSFEEELLLRRFQIPSSQILEFGFLLDEPGALFDFPYSQRKDFIFLGNYRHEPNLDGVLWTARHVWPLIQKVIPHATWTLFGAFSDERISTLCAPGTGIVWGGRCIDPLVEFSKARILLCPLRFGAGIKGKIVESWLAGTPVVTTPIGAEGMLGEYGKFGGEVGIDPEEIAQKAISLSSNETQWERARTHAKEILRTRFSKEPLRFRVRMRINGLMAGLREARDRNLTGRMLRHGLNQGTKYFSKWIEAKETMVKEKRILFSQALPSHSSEFLHRAE